MTFDEFAAAYGRPMIKDSGEYLFRQGDNDRSLYHLQSGLLKAYYLSADGKENVKSFLLPGDSIASIKAGFAGDGCSFNLVCLKPCQLIVLEFEKLYDACRSDAELSSAMVDFLLMLAMKKETREQELLCLSAEDRYRQLLRSKPELFELVTQNEIARYLGITPVALSRIKKRLG